VFRGRWAAKLGRPVRGTGQGACRRHAGYGDMVIAVANSVPYADAFGLVHTERACRLITAPARQRRWRDVASHRVCLTCQRVEHRRLLPGRPGIGLCRICRETKPLTEEHIPPRSAFNWDKARGHTGEEWLTVGPGVPLGGGSQRQGGISAFTLCQRCNSVTGTRYGAEYARWARVFHEGFERFPPDPEGDNDTGPRYYGGEIGNAELYPGRFIRQVLSTLATVSAGALTRGAPQVRDAILSGSPAEMPDGMGVFLALFPDRTRGRILSPMAEVDLASGEMVILCDYMHYPFAVVLVLAGVEHARVTGADIGWMLTHRPDEVGTGLRLHTPIARCHTPFPGDYRSLGQLRAESTLGSSEEFGVASPDGARTW
jgi:hypothetical protein